MISSLDGILQQSLYKTSGIESIVKLDNFYFPWELEQTIRSFVDYYNLHRYHEALDNLTPATVFEGRREEILQQRQLTKQRTLKQRQQRDLQLTLHTG